LHAGGVPHIVGKLSTRATNLLLISIGGLHAKLWASKVVGVPISGILRLPLGSLGTKCHLDAGPCGQAQNIL